MDQYDLLPGLSKQQRCGEGGRCCEKDGTTNKSGFGSANDSYMFDTVFLNNCRTSGGIPSALALLPWVSWQQTEAEAGRKRRQIVILR